MDGYIHVVEQGDGWEVWREGDSMPLGTFMTAGEADEKARAQAEADGVELVEHEQDIAADPVSPLAEATQAATELRD